MNSVAAHDGRTWLLKWQIDVARWQMTWSVDHCGVWTRLM